MFITVGIVIIILLFSFIAIIKGGVVFLIMIVYTIAGVAILYGGMLILFYFCDDD